LCGASWKYDECQYLIKKILRRQCVSHETVFNKATEIGQAASGESEGNRIKALEGDKKQQGDIACGKGPTISYAPAIQNNLRDQIIEVAEKKKIPYQRQASSRITGTDTDAFAYSEFF